MQKSNDPKFITAITNMIATFRSNTELDSTASELLQWIEDTVSVHLVSQAEISTIGKHTSHTLGFAYAENNQIALMQEAFTENEEEYMTLILPHELAHLIVAHLFGDVHPHGKEFHLVCKLLGFKAAGSAKFDIAVPHMKKNKTREHHYICGCKNSHVFSTVRHNKTVKNGLKYSCNTCGIALHFSHSIG
jgi:SprT protein